MCSYLLVHLLGEQLELGVRGRDALKNLKLKPNCFPHNSNEKIHLFGRRLALALFQVRVERHGLEHLTAGGANLGGELIRKFHQEIKVFFLKK